MINFLQNAFEITGPTPCISTTDKTIIEVYDCYTCLPKNARSYIKTSESEPIHFTLTNPLNALLTFAALDNCLLKSDDISRCDFILGNLSKLYFVEIKEVPIRNRRDARLDAIKQLESTLSFLENRIDFTKTIPVAVICLKAKKVHPLQNATSSAKAFSFKTKYNAVLKEGQSDTF